MDKMKMLRATRYSKLSRGEKVAKAVLSVVRLAVIAVVVLAVAGVAASCIAGIVIAIAVGNAIAGGFEGASRAYRPGDRYVKFF